MKHALSQIHHLFGLPPKAKWSYTGALLRPVGWCGENNGYSQPVTMNKHNRLELGIRAYKRIYTVIGAIGRAGLTTENKRFARQELRKAAS